jgi:MoaA/NifB/PqqE/SkfB family radical SAM enzyme
VRTLSLLADVVRNRTGGVPRPRFVTWAVTLRCNATCGACDSWKLPPQPELTVAEAAAVFRQLGPLDAVRLTGGEPTLRPDLSDLAEVVRRAARPAVLHLTTHGGFPDRVLAFAEAYAEPRRLQVLVSLDGMPEEHDRSRGRAVTFERAEETIRRLAALRPRGVRVAVNHTIVSRRSLADGEALRRRFAPLGVDVQPVVAYEASATYGLALQGRRAEALILGDGYPLHPALDQAETLAFVERALSDLGFLGDRGTRLAKRYYLRGLASRLRGEPAARPRPRCVALRSHLRILPDGGVPVCQFNGERVGRLPVQPLAEVWAGAPARKARAWVDACAGCWAECEVLPNAVYSGDVLRP